MTRKSLMGWALGWIAVVLMSVIWHFPASYVLNLSSVKTAMPPGLNLNQVQGAWWKATTHITWQQIALGQIAWQWQPSKLLSGQLGLDLQWMNAGQTARLQLQTDGETVQMSDLNGQVKLAFISQLNPNLALLNGAQGEVVLKDLMLVSSLQQPWPTQVAGKLVLVDLNAMGIVVNTAEIQPELQNNVVVFNVQAKDKGWTLNGKTQLIQPNRFESQYQLNAQTAEQMPSWVSLMMHQTAPTQAEMNGRGTW